MCVKVVTAGTAATSTSRQAETPSSVFTGSLSQRQVLMDENKSLAVSIIASRLNVFALPKTTVPRVSLPLSIRR
jgi:hypothetical protein